MASGQPWLPSYLGSYDDLVRALLNNPFLGSGRGPTGPHAAEETRSDAFNPEPSPWRPVVESLVAAASVRVLATRVADQDLHAAMEESASQSIAQLLDDYCGTPPRVWPWPWPGPPPWVTAIATELNAIASIISEDELRSSVQEVAAQVVAKGFGARVRQ